MFDFMLFLSRGSSPLPHSLSVNRASSSSSLSLSRPPSVDFNCSTQQQQCWSQHKHTPLLRAFAAANILPMVFSHSLLHFLSFVKSLLRWNTHKIGGNHSRRGGGGTLYRVFNSLTHSFALCIVFDIAGGVGSRIFVAAAVVCIYS